DLLAEDVVEVLGQHDRHVRRGARLDGRQRLRIGFRVPAREHGLDLNLRMALVPLLDVSVDEAGERPGDPDRIVELELRLRLRHRNEASDQRDNDSGEQRAELHERLLGWGLDHPFRPDWVKDSMNRRWNRTNSTISGAITMRVPAQINPHSAPDSDARVKDWRPTASTRFLLLEVATRGQRNSFQW